MPLLNDLKKIFFGAKSVAKHQVEKATEAAQEAAEELQDKAPEYIDQGKEALSKLGDKVFREADLLADKGRELKDRAGDLINSQLSELKDPTEEGLDIIDEELELGRLDEVPESEAPKSGSIDFEADLQEPTTPAAPKAPSAVGRAANSALDAAARTGVSAKESAGKLAGKLGATGAAVGDEVLKKSDEILSRAAEIGSDLKGKADAFVEHANREAEKMKIEESIEEAKAAAAQAEARARAFDGQESSRDAGDSTLSGTDSFFERAERFAAGDYHNEGGKDLRVQDDPNYKKEKKSDLIAGFLDSDGDGDSLIDDAVIEEE